MIYYFTGTGNSLAVAEELARLTGDEVAAIAEIMRGAPMPPPGERCGIVFPVFAWAPPQMVVDFLKRHPIQSPYIYCVCTCADSAGGSVRLVEKSLGRKLSYACSVQMPSNFIIAGDVESEEESRKKRLAARETLQIIAAELQRGERGVYRVREGVLGGSLTRLIAPLFNAFALSDKSFYAEKSCNGCGRCVRVCPAYNVRLEDKRPCWGGQCTFCLACIHHCPVQAIQRGRGTKKKGRYVNPDCRVEYRAEFER